MPSVVTHSAKMATRRWSNIGGTSPPALSTSSSADLFQYPRAGAVDPVMDGVEERPANERYDPIVPSAYVMLEPHVAPDELLIDDLGRIRASSSMAAMGNRIPCRLTPCKVCNSSSEGVWKSLAYAFGDKKGSINGRASTSSD